jgi:hypothetical protein
MHQYWRNYEGTLGRRLAFNALRAGGPRRAAVSRRTVVFRWVRAAIACGAFGGVDGQYRHRMAPVRSCAPVVRNCSQFRGWEHLGIPGVAGACQEGLDLVPGRRRDGQGAPAGVRGMARRDAYIRAMRAAMVNPCRWT